MKNTFTISKESYNNLLKVIKTIPNLVKFGKSKAFLEESYSVKDEKAKTEKNIKKRAIFPIEKYMYYDTYIKSIVDITIIEADDVYKLYITSPSNLLLEKSFIIKKVVQNIVENE